MYPFLNDLEKLTPQMFVQQKLEFQKKVWKYHYPTGAITVLANNVNTVSTVQISNAAGFYWTGLSGSFTLGAGGTEPLCSVLITDLGAGGKRLFNDYVPLQNILTPGNIANALYEPIPFEYYVDKNSTLQFEFLNSHVATVTVNLLLHGFWYEY